MLAIHITGKSASKNVYMRKSLPPSNGDGILYRKGSSYRKVKTFDNKIALNLDSNAEASVKGFIAPIEYTQRNYHVDWDELANLSVAEPEKQLFRIGFSGISATGTGFGG